VAVAALSAAALALPRFAAACAVCGADGAGNRAAFFWTTVLLSLLPLAMVGVGVAIALRAARERLADEFADRDAPAVSTTKTAAGTRS
jgi:hypothetical protein